MLYANDINLLDAKTAVVTGGSRGIGSAIAIRLALSGANIAIIYSGNTAQAESTAKHIKSMGVKCFIYKCDVSSFDMVKSTVDNIVKDLGGVDILVNNAGITADKLTLQMTEDDFDRVVDINLKGAFNMIRHISPIMARKRSGKIINISSVSGLMGNVGQANYSAAKAGLIGLTKTIAKEYAARNINCNAVAPGFIETDMTSQLSDKVKEQLLQTIPLRRMGSPDDIANITVFLASKYADYITGSVFKVDGGIYI